MGVANNHPQFFMSGIFRFFEKLSGRSTKWASVRKQHLEKQPYCQACGKTENLIVHHIEPYSINPSRELDPTNLITLCSKTCHLTFGHLMDYKSWNKDVVKDCSTFLSKIKKRPYYENFSQAYSDSSLFFRLIDKLRQMWYN